MFEIYYFAYFPHVTSFNNLLRQGFKKYILLKFNIQSLGYTLVHRSYTNYPGPERENTQLKEITAQQSGDT